MKKIIIKLLLKLLLKNESRALGKEVDEVKRFSVYARMNKDPDIVNLFKSLYTRTYNSIVINTAQNVDNYQAGFFAGRLFERLMDLKNMEEAKKNLLDYDKMEKQKSAFGQKIEQAQSLMKKFFIRKPF